MSFTGGENVCSDIIKRLLDFILVMYVRKSVLFGARSIEVSNNVDNENIIINLKITNKADAIYFNIPETFSTDFSEEIICKTAIKMKGEYFVDSNGMKLVFPVQKSEATKLNSSAKSYGKPLFSITKNILSDLSDISLI